MLKDCRLYVIVESGAGKVRDLPQTAEEVLAGGADIIQLRDKSSRDREILEAALILKKVCRRHKALLIINDRADIARAVKADGLHLGQDDMPIDAARAILGPGSIIGISTHSLRQAEEAEKSGADYIGIGPIFKTTTKPSALPIGVSVLSKIKEKIGIPYFAIGGIYPHNIKDILSKGATRIAVSSAIMKSKDIKEAASGLKSILK